MKYTSSEAKLPAKFPSEYTTSKDVALETSRVEEAGWKLLFPKMSIGEFGFISQFIDAEGNRVGLHSSE